MIGLLVATTAASGQAQGPQDTLSSPEKTSGLRTCSTWVMIGPNTAAERDFQDVIQAFMLCRYPGRTIEFRHVPSPGAGMAPDLTSILAAASARPVLVTAEVTWDDYAGWYKHHSDFLVDPGSALRSLANECRGAGATLVLLGPGPANLPQKAAHDAGWDTFITRIHGFTIENNLLFADPQDYLEACGAGNIHTPEADSVLRASAILKLMGAQGLVGRVEVDVAQGRAETRRAEVRRLEFRSDGVTFDRMDDALPLPVLDSARPALALRGECALGRPSGLFGMSRLELMVKGLRQGRYDVLIDGVTVSRANSAEIAAGLDVGLAGSCPQMRQSLAVLDRIRKQGPAVGVDARPQWHRWVIHYAGMADHVTYATPEN